MDVLPPPPAPSVNHDSDTRGKTRDFSIGYICSVFRVSDLDII